MPCRCDGYPDIPDYHSGPAADALCKVLKEHEAKGEMECFDKATLEWWEEHKRRDAQKADYERNMSEPIKAGDLVQIVKSCCAAHIESSPIFEVTTFWTGGIHFQAICSYCRAALPREEFAWAPAPGKPKPAYPVSWLKRIPPLEELKGCSEDARQGQGGKVPA